MPNKKRQGKSDLLSFSGVSAGPLIDSEHKNLFDFFTEIRLTIYDGAVAFNALKTNNKKSQTQSYKRLAAGISLLKQE